MVYAKGTQVAPEKTRGEIERTLARYKADQFGYSYGERGAQINFRMKGRLFRTVLVFPRLEEFKRRPPTRSGFLGAVRTPQQQEDARAQVIRERWRALLLIIKAKLEAVESGIASLEEEFIGWTILPDGSTLAQHALPAIEKAYQDGLMPGEDKLLALPAKGGES